ncbi:MAG: prepilin-type N-terminal cleavage/methylation domain-containing protein [Smithellaceae bacterium]|nr:prepilin-type N-terminal cleavage/methylation domain-containing protein [Smithellaceae bacterium]
MRRKDGFADTGFTLLEVIIVLLLAALMMGLTGIFVVQHMSSQEIKATASNISSVIKRARTMASANWKTQEISFDMERGTYSANGRQYRVPAGLTVSVSDAIKGEISDGTYVFNIQPGGQMDGSAVILRGRSKALLIKGDPVKGAEVSVLE